jgi:hypothetical protein
MVNWQVTATTVHCETVNEDVTLLVNKDWSVKCTGFTKYGKTGKSANSRDRQNHKCEGTGCHLAVQYRQKLQAEETKAVNS